MLDRAKKVVVIGAGGHAKVAIDVLHSLSLLVPFCVGTAGDLEFCNKVPVKKDIQSLQDLHDLGFRNIFVGIGDNQIRTRIGLEAHELGLNIVTAISPHSTISKSASINEGVLVMPGAVINADSSLERLVIVNTNSVVEHDCLIGSGAHVAPSSTLLGGVSVGECTLIGAGSVVLPNVKIGKEVKIGAGAVVLNDVSDFETHLGVPSRKYLRGQK